MFVSHCYDSADYIHNYDELTAFKKHDLEK
ncbi:hypothetical protein [Pseudomonas sp. Ant30-3]|nr:hypothetical protein [Pseudomonas sp. Ant30-3]